MPPVQTGAFKVGIGTGGVRRLAAARGVCYRAAVPSIAKVVVERAIDREFDYRIPPELEAEIRIGTPVVVPFGRSEAHGYVVGLADRSARADLKSIRQAAGRKALIGERVLELARWMAEYYAAPIEACVRTVLPGAVRRHGAGYVERRMVLPGPRAGDAAAVEALRKRAPKQAAVLDVLRRSGEVFLARLARQAGAAPAAVRALEKKGFVRIEDRAAERDPMSRREILPTAPLALMPEQQSALALVVAAIDGAKPSVVLLHGVTGSGKTEVYLQAIAHARARGRGAIVLVPEIALTPQTVERFRGRFGAGVAILHSHLSDGERHDEWHRLHEGRAAIAIGARSALFAPVRDLGLIVVDEEHESTYKQEEAPRYNARDAAVMRGRLEGAAVLLGSATPSLESYRNALAGKYALATLPRRADDRRMPVVRVVDMRVEAERAGRPHVLSKDLVEAMRDRMARGEQTILFLNRRGYATALVCPKCGHVANCDACSVAMTYHKREDRLVCHLCGASRAVPDRCPAPGCGDPSFRMAGLGTERVEEIVRRLFPKAGVERMDSDTMTRKESYHRVLGAFRTGRVDILIGTQMIAKGLHFPNVTLVGVVFADVTLHMPDFRAGERTFQLLTQVAGRAGRGDVSGEVIVQTYTPFHPAVQAARRMDFEGFCDQELAFRRELSYPPFAHLVCVTLKGPVEERVSFSAQTLAKALRERLPKEAFLSDPAPAPIARVKGDYRWQLMARAPAARSVVRPLREILAGLRWPEQVTCAVDVDALALL